MKTVTNNSLALIASTCLLASVAAADDPKLVAPVYKGAVPAVLADGAVPNTRGTGNFGGVRVIDCGAAGFEDNDQGPWCFLSSDAIDKVKAFYDKAVGPMYPIAGTGPGDSLLTMDKPVQGYAVYAEQAWLEGIGESRAAGINYRGVSLHALPPSPKLDGNTETNEYLEKYADGRWEGDTANQFYSQTRHFSGLVNGVDWFGDPSMRQPAELDAVYKKHGKLEAALFQRKGPGSKAADAILREQYEARKVALIESSIQSMQNAQGAAMMTAQQAMQQAKNNTLPADQAASPEDAEFEAYMQRNPAVARKFMDLTQRLMALMRQGKYDEADQVDEELEQLLDDNPELAAIEARSEQRSASMNQPAPNNAAMDDSVNAMDKANWGTWLEYIGAAEKEAYYTLIVIDAAFTGNEPSYSRDRKVFDQSIAGTAPHQAVFGFHYDHKPQALAGQQQPEVGDDESKQGLKDKAKKGLKALLGKD